MDNGCYYIPLFCARFQKDRVNQAEKSKRRLSMELNGVKSTLSMQEREGTILFVCLFVSHE